MTQLDARFGAVELRFPGTHTRAEAIALAERALAAMGDDPDSLATRWEAAVRAAERKWSTPQFAAQELASLEELPPGRYSLATLAGVADPQGRPLSAESVMRERHQLLGLGRGLVVPTRGAGKAKASKVQPKRADRPKSQGQAAPQAEAQP